MEIEQHVQQSCTEGLEAFPMRSLVRYDQTLRNDQACLCKECITRPLRGSSARSDGEARWLQLRIRLAC